MFAFACVAEGSATNASPRNEKTVLWTDLVDPRTGTQWAPITQYLPAQTSPKDGSCLLLVIYAVLHVGVSDIAIVAEKQTVASSSSSRSSIPDASVV